MRVDKPWGWYEDLHRSPDLVFKRICVMPRQMLSLQKHAKRGETWILPGTSGVVITLGNVHYIDSYGLKSLYIAPGVEHRIENNGTEPFTFLEVQEGQCSEDDIVRIADIYGRL